MMVLSFALFLFFLLHICSLLFVAVFVPGGWFWSWDYPVLIPSECNPPVLLDSMTLRAG